MREMCYSLYVFRRWAPPIYPNTGGVLFARKPEPTPMPGVILFVNDYTRG